jgi:outer membrane protein insertion porin family
MTESRPPSPPAGDGRAFGPAAGAPPPPRRPLRARLRRARRLLSILALLLLTAGVVAAVLLALAASTWGEELLATQLRQRLGDRLEADVELDAIDLRPLAGVLELHRLELSGGDRVIEHLSVPRAAVGISRRALLRGRLRIRSLELDSPVIHLRAPSGDGDGGVATDVLARLRRLQVRDGVLVYEDGRWPFELEAEGLRASGAGGATGTGGRLRIERLRLAPGPLPPTVLRDVQARWTWDAPRLRIEELAAEGPDAAATGHATVVLGEEGVFVEARAHGRASLAWLDIVETFDMSGSIEGDVAVRYSPTERWRIEGRAENAGPLTLAEFPLEQAEARFTATPAGIYVTEGRGSTPAGSVFSDVELSWVEGSWTAAGGGTARIADLLARVDLPAATASGRMAFSFAATRPEPDATVRWDLQGEVTAIEAAAAGLGGTVRAGAGPDGGRVRLFGAWGSSLVDATLRWPGEEALRDWQAEGELAAPSRGAARAAIDRLERLGVRFGFELPAALRPRAEGPLTLTATAHGDRRAVDAVDAAWEVATASLGGTARGRIEGRLDLRPGRRWDLDLRLGADDRGGGLLVELSSAGERPPRITAIGERVPAAWIVAGARAAGLEPPPVAGGLASGSVEGRLGEQPELRFAGRFAGELEHGPPLDVDVHGGWSAGRLRLGGLEVRSPGVELSARGSVDTGEETAVVTLRGQLAAELDRLDPLLLPFPAAGRVRASGRVVFRGVERPLRAEGGIEWGPLRLDGMAVPAGRADLEPRPDGLAVVAVADPLRVDAELTGAIGDPRLGLRTAWSEMEAISLIERSLGLSLPVAVAVWSSGELTVSGPAAAPERWTGSGVLGTLRVEGPSLALDMTDAAALAVEPGGVVRVVQQAPVVLEDGFGDRLSIAGTIDAWGADAGQLDVLARGAADLQVAEVLDPDLLARGRADLEVVVSGDVRDPAVEGSVIVTGGRLRWLTLREAIDRLEAQVNFDGHEARIERGSFRLGGGQVRLGGTVSLANWLPERLDVGVTARDVALSIPDGMWGRYNADLQLVGPVEEPQIEGDVTMLAGRYTRPFELAPLPWVRSRRLEPEWSAAAWPTRIGLRLDLDAGPVLSVRNDVARLEASLSLAVGGSVGQPLPAGAVSFLEGGRLRFRGVEYEVQSGQLTMDELRGEPTRLRLRATTEVRGYTVRLELDASTESIDYALTSVPALSEADIFALLLTGETLSERGAESAFDADVAASYFGSQLGEILFSEPARRVLGVTEFRIAPTRIGPDARPTARVTLGRRLDDRTSVIYSRDLSGEGRDLYRLERELRRGLRFGLGREPLGGVAADLRWMHRFGVEPADERPEPPLRLARDGLDISGLPEDIEVRPRRGLGLSRGERLTRSDAIQARDALRRELVGAGYVEADVDAAIVEPEQARSRGRLALAVEAGPRWQLRIEAPPGVLRDVRETLADLWAGTDFRREALDEARRVLREMLAEQGHSAAVVEVREEEGVERGLLVEVDPGPRVGVASLSFEGLEVLDEEDVRDQVLSRPAIGLTRTIYRPRTLETDLQAIRTLYESRGYLDVALDARVRYLGAGKAVDITIVVEEGGRHTFGAVRVEGDWPDELGPATELIPVRSGQPFEPARLRAAEAALREALDAAGYYEGRVAARPTPTDHTVDVTFRVWAESRAVVEEVEVEGVEHTHPKLVRRSLHVEPDEPLTSRALRATERDLFRLGLFSDVDIDVVPLEEDPERRRVVVRLEEMPRFSLLAAVGYDTEEKLRVSAALSNENLAGRGRIGGVQAWASSLRRGFRFTLEDRHINRARWEGLAAIGPEREEKEGFTLETFGATLQVGSRRRVRNRWQLRYSLERTDVSDVTLDEEALREALDVERLPGPNQRLAGVIGSVLVDRRDDPFLPDDGWLARSELGLWTRTLGSEETFVSWTGQLAGYEDIGSRVALAGSVRLSLGWSYGDTEVIPLSQRFFAGGSDTIRGFARDRAGPFDPETGEYLGGGGEARWLTNFEVRYRVLPQFDAAVFYDSGNVFLTVEDLDLGDLRETYGLALRWRSPVGLVRLEYGRKLDPRPGESSGEVFLSIGEPW